MFLKVIVLGALLRLLISTEKPFLCSGIYAVFAFLIGSAFAESLLEAFVCAGIGFAFASLYFWVLNRLDSGSLLWWLVAAGGALLAVV